MSARGVEAFLARLYSDAALRERFLRNEKIAMADLPLTEIEQADLLQIDRVGLQMAAVSYANKRVHHKRKRKFFAGRFLAFLFRR